MKVPKYIKELIKEREKYAMGYISCESKLNDWLDKKGIFEKVTCGEHGYLFNSGAVAICESGTTEITIKYLESL